MFDSILLSYFPRLYKADSTIGLNIELSGNNAMKNGMNYILHGICFATRAERGIIIPVFLKGKSLIHKHTIIGIILL